MICLDFFRALCRLFANDAAIHTSSTDLNAVHNTLQNSIRDLIKWSEQNHMSLCPSETKCMLMTKDKRGKT